MRVPPCAAEPLAPDEKDVLILSAPHVSVLLPVLLSVAESAVHVLEEDDGSGWVKVADDSGGKGLVPASYIEFRELGGAQAQARSATPSLARPQATANVDYGTYNSSSVLYRPRAFFGFCSIRDEG